MKCSMTVGGKRWSYDQRERRVIRANLPISRFKNRETQEQGELKIWEREQGARVGHQQDHDLTLDKPKR